MALVDLLQAGMLNDAQREAVYALRAGLLAMAVRIAEPLDESADSASRSDPAANSV